MCVLVCAGCALVQGCSGPSDLNTERESLPVYASTVPPQTASTQHLEVFKQVAMAMDPVPAFGLVELPEGVAVAPYWWPVIEAGATSGSAEHRDNPMIQGRGESDPEAEVLLAYEDGWLCVIENFRGDLGDVQGESVGTVQGNPAHLYEVNGGLLVQWSYQGGWYGVFGRDVAPDAVVNTALALTLVPQR